MLYPMANQYPGIVEVVSGWVAGSDEDEAKPGPGVEIVTYEKIAEAESEPDSGAEMAPILRTRGRNRTQQVETDVALVGPIHWV